MEKRNESSSNCKRKIAFIGCSKSKKDFPCKAKNMYKGSLFRKAFSYCTINNFEIWILSSKYGLLNPENEIIPYNDTLKTKNKQELKSWSDKVKKQIKKQKIKGEFWFFCGKTYHMYFQGNKPLSNLSIGKQLKWFNKKINKKCSLF